jgi:DUF4097 and DUF4098 domain-containing protein YvlB
MDEERTRILKMLEAGKITAAEAEKLLLALKGQPRVDMSRDEMRARMRRFGLREGRHAHIAETIREQMLGARQEMLGAREALLGAFEEGQGAAIRRQRFEYQGVGKLLVRNVSGDTVIEGWDKPTVRFDREEGGLWRANEREGAIMAKVLSGDLRVRTPKQTALTVNSVSGDLTVKGVSGRAEMRTVSGDVLLRNLKGTLDIATTSGDIKTRDIDGKCRVATVSGDIDLGFRAELSGLVETRTGDVQVWVPTNANLLLELEVIEDGDIEVDLAPDVPCEKTEAGEGHVKLGFGKKENRLWVRVRNGDIDVDSYLAEPHEPVEPELPAEPEEPTSESGKE